MSHPPVKALLLDADGVVQWPARSWIPDMERLGGLGFLRLATAAEVPVLDGSGDLRPAIEELLAARGRRATFEEVIAAWCRIEPDRRMLALVERVRATGTITALATNQQSYRGAWIQANLGYERHFDHQFHSFQVGLAKPDPAYFRHIVDTLGIEPEEAVFVDDMAANVAGARRAGLRAVRFGILDTYGELRWELRRLGVPGI
jgi:putative hydrolase of the HAD superfamily